MEKGTEKEGESERERGGVERESESGRIGEMR